MVQLLLSFWSQSNISSCPMSVALFTMKTNFISAEDFVCFAQLRLVKYVKCRTGNHLNCSDAVFLPLGSFQSLTKRFLFLCSLDNCFFLFVSLSVLLLHPFFLSCPPPPFFFLVGKSYLLLVKPAL